MSTIAWLDCTAGASGDMLLGALVGAGVPLSTMQEAVDAVGVEPIELTSHSVTRCGVAATKVDPRFATAPERSWLDIRQLLVSADLDDAVRSLALDVFQRLADAEATVHATHPDDVHFHEVGALDSIADVVGAAAGLTALAAERIVASPVTVGSGTVRAAHGLLPVPGPAVVELLRAAGAPVQGGSVTHEMCTPTGAALLTTIVTAWGPLPPMRIDAIGCGAGTRDLPELPNVLRLAVGSPVESAGDQEATSALVVEANVDDLDPRLWPAVLGRLLDAGASDAWLTPILMKKGRPAHTLSVLVSDAAADAVRRVLFTETSTIGVREARYAKRALDRQIVTVLVEGLPVRVKLATLDGEPVNAQPEYDDVAAVAARLGRPMKTVLAAAVAAAHEAGLLG